MRRNTTYHTTIRASLSWLGAICALAGNTAWPHAPPRFHVVESGDTLSEIAEKQGIALDDLRHWNDLSGDLIYPGQRLALGPGASAPTSSHEEATMTDAAAGSRASPASNQPENRENEDSADVATATDTSKDGERDDSHEADGEAEYGFSAEDLLESRECMAARFRGNRRNQDGEPVAGPSSGAADSSPPAVPERSPAADGEGEVDSPSGDRSSPSPAAQRGQRRGTHVVRSGETLSGIAADYDIPLADLLQWNPSVEADRIRAGQLIQLRRCEIHHRVALGDTVWSLARDYGVTIDDIVRWNEGLKPRALREGQPLVILTNEGDSLSLGAPNEGRLVRGVGAPPHRAYVIRNPERSYGTEETIDHLVAAFKAVLARHPRAARVRLHDISLPHGGPMDDHRSHQSGRDVDLSYYQRQCPRRQGCPFVGVSRSQLAAGPQWTLFEHWLRKDVVDQIFVDYSLQSALFEEAQKSGATPSQLAVWFQYPRGRRAPPGIIRHYRNHRNHLHVRFRCPPGDEACR